MVTARTTTLRGFVEATRERVAAFTHVWWNGDGPAEDPYADMEQLHASRARVLAVADVAIPGHGPALAPSDATPR